MRKSFQFGLYHFDSEKLELKKAGHSVKLPQQSAVLLGMMLECAGEVVTREQMKDRVWPEGTHVEFDFGLNTAINRIRRVLDDSARLPRFIETVPKVGYRFIADYRVLGMREEAQPQVAATGKLKAWWAWVAVGLALLVGEWGAGRLGKPVEALPGVKSAILLPEGHALRQLRISPSGDRIVYVAGANAYTRYLNRNESIRVDGIDGVLAVAFSPDGSELAIWGTDSLQVLTEKGLEVIWKSGRKMQISNGVWSTNGYLYFSDQGIERPAIFRIRRTGGDAEMVKQLPDRFGKVVFPILQEVHDQGDLMLYSTVLSVNDRSLRVWRGRNGLESEKDLELLEKAMGGMDLASGHLLHYWLGEIFATPWDREALKIRGAPVKVLDSVRERPWQGAMLDVSRNGTLVYSKEDPIPQRRVVVIDESGRRTPIDIPPGEYQQLRLSPVGDQLAIVRKDERNKWGIWLYGLKTKAWSKLFEETGSWTRVVWRPDGKALVAGLLNGSEGLANLHLVTLDNAAGVRRLLEEPRFGQFPTDWSAKRNEIVFMEGFRSKERVDLKTLQIDGMKMQTLVSTDGVDLDGVVSPDGKWLAFASEVSGRRKIYVRAMEARGTGELVSDIDGHGPIWSASGDRIWFSAFEQGGLLEVRMAGGKAVGKAVQKYGEMRMLYPDVWTRSYDVAGDGKLYAIEIEDAKPARVSVEMVTNWFAELAKLAPTGK